MVYATIRDFVYIGVVSKEANARQTLAMKPRPTKRRDAIYATTIRN